MSHPVHELGLYYSPFINPVVRPARPVFVVAPGNKVVAVGRRLSVKCTVTGSPPPAVYWSNVATQVCWAARKQSSVAVGPAVIRGVCSRLKTISVT